MEGAIVDQNDQALIGHFLRGMVRFRKFVRLQEGTDEHVQQRIQTAYQEALNTFTSQQKGTRK